MARPLIAADSIGCREPVEDGETGYLCRPKDPRDLALQMTRFISLTPQQRTRMGQLGREKMEREYDMQIVIRSYIKHIEDIIWSNS